MRNKYKDMTSEELLNEENELRTAMFNLRLKNTTKELENTSTLKSTRRELARVMTALSQHQRIAKAAAE